MADSGGEIDLVELASLSQQRKGFDHHFKFTNYSGTYQPRGALHTISLGMPAILVVVIHKFKKKDFLQLF